MIFVAMFMYSYNTLNKNSILSLTNDDIKLKIETILNYHSISFDERDAEIISNVMSYWNEYGKHYNVVKNRSLSFNINKISMMSAQPQTCENTKVFLVNDKEELVALQDVSH